MDPSIIVAGLVAIQVLWQAYAKYKAEKLKINSDSETTLAGVVDKRIQLILDSNTREIERLQAVDQQLRDVLAFLRAANIRWPPDEEPINEITPAGGPEGQ